MIAKDITKDDLVTLSPHSIFIFKLKYKENGFVYVETNSRPNECIELLEYNYVYKIN